MNSSASETTNSQVTPFECELYPFLGGKLDHTTTEAYAVLVFLIVVNIITFPFTTVFNVLVMIAVKTKPRLESMSNVALGCLATTDGLVGAFAQPLFVASLATILHGESSSLNCTLQRLTRNPVRVLCASSLFHLVLMNIERYIAIKHSFEHITMVTAPRILYSSALAWTVTLVLTLPLAIIDTDIYLAVSNVTLLLCVAIVIFCQVVLYCETRRHEKAIAVQEVSVEARQKFLKEKKALKLTTTVLFILVLSYSPMILVRVLIVNSVINSLNMKYIAFFTATFVVLLNSLINPIIYCVRIRQFRVAFIEILLRKSHAQAEDIEIRILGTLNAAAPLAGGQEREEAQEQENPDNSDNNNDSNNNNNNNEDDGNDNNSDDSNNNNNNNNNNGDSNNIDNDNSGGSNDSNNDDHDSNNSNKQYHR